MFRQKTLFGSKRLSRIPHIGYKKKSNLEVLFSRYQVLFCMEQIIPVLIPGEFSKYFDFDRLKNFNLLRINIDLSFCKKPIFSQNVLL